MTLIAQRFWICIASARNMTDFLKLRKIVSLPHFAIQISGKHLLCLQAEIGVLGLTAAAMQQ